MYELTDQKARVIKKKEDFLELVNVVFSNNGQNKKSEIVDSKIIPHASFSEIQLLYRTNFEKSEQYENFTWYVKDGIAGLFSYNITNINQSESRLEKKISN